MHRHNEIMDCNKTKEWNIAFCYHMEIAANYSYANNE